jgi:hypothetical protein
MNLYTVNLPTACFVWRGARFATDLNQTQQLMDYLFQQETPGFGIALISHGNIYDHIC